MKLQDDILGLIAKDLAGLTNSAEKSQLKDWTEISIANRKYYEQLRIIWEVSDKQIDPTLRNNEDDLKKLLTRIGNPSKKRTFWYYWQRIAAVIILPLLIGILLLIYSSSDKRLSFNENNYNEIFTPFGTRSLLTLEDSTIVCLNAGSRLKYPMQFKNNLRRVYLHGEAYFEVRSDVSRPFIVQTPTLNVEAVGTKFNVRENSSNPNSEITLVSGKIIVRELQNKKEPHLISELAPNQHLSFNRITRSHSVFEAESYKYIAWKDGKLVFRNDPLPDVLLKIGEMFNVDIELQGEELQNYRYHATFQDESFEEILRLLKLSAPLNYIEVKREPLADGSFPKKKVIVTPLKK